MFIYTVKNEQRSNGKYYTVETLVSIYENTILFDTSYKRCPEKDSTLGFFT